MFSKGKQQEKQPIQEKNYKYFFFFNLLISYSKSF